MLDLSTLLAWSSWQPLRQAPGSTLIPATAGPYRIRRQGRDDLDSIGQTGAGSMNLRRPLAMLRGVYELSCLIAIRIPQGQHSGPCAIGQRAT